MYVCMYVCMYTQFIIQQDVEREPGTVAAFSNAALRSRKGNIIPPFHFFVCSAYLTTLFLLLSIVFILVIWRFSVSIFSVYFLCLFSCRSMKGIELEVLNCGNLVATSDTTTTSTSSSANGTNTTNNNKSSGGGGKDHVATGALKDIHNAKYDHLTVRHVLETESFMVPMVSLDCSRCTIHYTPKAEENNPTFEIIEKIPLTGVSSIFRKEKERKIVLRAQDQQQLIDWILKFETK